MKSTLCAFSKSFNINTYPPLINTFSGHHISDVGLLTHTPHDQHYWAWFMDINGGWPDSGNLMVGGPIAET
jgi:hypothetical protein